MTPRGIGDNGGPPLEDEPPDPGASWRLWCWKRAHKRAWKTPPREIALRRLANAEARGMTYREYTLEIMERGVHLGAPDVPDVGEAPSHPRSLSPPVPATPEPSPNASRGFPAIRTSQRRAAWMAVMRRP